MAFLYCTKVFLTLAIFFNAAIVHSYDTVPITGSKVCKMYNRGRSLRDTLIFTWKGLKLSAGCRLDFRESKQNKICVDIDAKLSCSSAPLSIIQNTHLESVMHYFDCKMRTQQWCSKSRLTVIFKPSLYSNYKNDVTVKFYLADEKEEECHVMPVYPDFHNNDGDDDFFIEQSETVHDTAMSITVVVGIIIALIIGGIIVITLIICCCCCKGRRTQGHVYRPTAVTTTTTVVTQQLNQPPQYPAQTTAGYHGYQANPPALPAAQMAPPHQGTSPGYPPQTQTSKPEPSAPPAPSAPYMQDMPYYPPPQDQSYPPPPSQAYPPQPYGGMVAPPPYSEK